MSESDTKLYTLQNISIGWDELNPYVKTKNNSLVLELPRNIQLASDLKAQVETHLNTINQSVKERDLEIEPDGRIIDKKLFVEKNMGKMQFIFTGII